MTIYQNETEVGTTTANVDSQWTFTPSLTEDDSYSSRPRPPTRPAMRATPYRTPTHHHRHRGAGGADNYYKGRLSGGVQGYAGLGSTGYEFDGDFLRSPTNNAVTLT